MNLRIFKLLFVPAFLLMVFSCEGYLDQFKFGNIDTEMQFEPSAALPVVYGSFSIQDVLESIDSTSFVDQTSDGLIYIYYQDTIVDLNASQFLEVPDRDFIQSYFQSDVNIPGWINLNQGESLSFGKKEELIFTEEDGDRLDSVFLSGGKLQFDIFSEFKHPGSLQISSPNFFDTNGDTLAIEILISDASGNYTHLEEVDLSGYTMRIIEESNVNSYEMNLLLTLFKTDADIQTGEEVGIAIGFRDLSFSEMYGYISPREAFSIEQSIELPFFNTISDVLDFSFKDPNFNLYVHNSFGLPVSIDLTKMQVRSSKDGQFYDLIFRNDTMMPFDIYAPTVDQIGSSVTTARYINPETSNIDEILSHLPDLVDISVAANAGTDNPDDIFFLEQGSKVQLETELILPMWLKTDGYTLQDTLDLDLNGVLGEVSLLESASFTLKTTNELPLQLELQAYFLDAGGLVLDSLFKNDNPFILAAPVDANGELDEDQLTENIVTISVTEDQLQRIEGTKKLWIYAHAETSDNGSSFVKFYSHYLLNYGLSIDAHFKINPGEVL